MGKPNPQTDVATSVTARFPEPVTRLAAIRHSLRLVEPFGHGPASDHDLDHDDDAAVAAAWDGAGPARRAAFDRRSGQLIAAAGAGIEGLMASLAAGVAPNADASAELSAQIRAELRDIAGIVLD